MMNIPLAIPDIGDEEIDAVAKVLRSGWLAHGPVNKEFERLFAEYLGVPFATSLNSCASALQLAIEAHGVTGEVILPSFTMSASANAVVRAGAIPVFVDIDPLTLNIDPAAAAEAISPRTKAIMPVHFAGLACDMPAIMALAKAHDLVVVEDSAESLGALIEDRMAGSFATGCFSFYPTKNITTGEGGMVVTSDPELKTKIDALKAHGMAKSTFDREKASQPWQRDSIYAGYNFRMCDVLAAIGVVQLGKIDRLNGLRSSHAAYYMGQLRDLPQLRFQTVPPGYRHVYQMLTVILDPAYDRNTVVLKLREAGIGASVHFDPPVHRQTFYKRNFSDSCANLENTDRICDHILTLPLYPTMEENQIDYVVDTFKRIIS